MTRLIPGIVRLRFTSCPYEQPDPADIARFNVEGERLLYRMPNTYFLQEKE